jgi:signal transduction histidine kinase
VIYLITAIAFSEVQRVLASETERVDDLVLAVRTSTERRDRLEATHSLLEDLLRIATSPDLNAVVAARDALRDIGIVVPDAVAQIIRNGDVNLARRGQPPALPATDTIPILRGGQAIARLDLWSEGEPLTPKQRTALEATVEPVGLALENDAMVQQLARLAIQRERVRLARELHDDIAPSIASVGLALDMMLLSDDLDTEQRRNLDATRSNVTRPRREHSQPCSGPPSGSHDEPGRGRPLTRCRGRHRWSHRDRRHRRADTSAACHRHGDLLPPDGGLQECRHPLRMAPSSA